jgi:hypothetical protein
MYLLSPKARCYAFDSFKKDSTVRKIDIFAHILPRSYLDRLERQLEKLAKAVPSKSRTLLGASQHVSMLEDGSAAPVARILALLFRLDRPFHACQARGRGPHGFWA